jgi:4-hydroxyphenylacetate 3-monooxygenase
MSSDVKTGADHRASLRDGRNVYINGERVEDVTVHPAFRHCIDSSVALYDYQAHPDNIELLTFESPTRKGRRVNRCWQIPRNYEELVHRREALVSWLTPHAGFIGRSPDHLASSLLGQVIGIDLFRQHGEDRAQALLDYFQYVRDNDHFLTYVIINPQVDRSKAWGDQPDEELVAGVVDEDSEGITVRGAKMLGTSSIMANEVFVANLQPLRPGEEKYAISFALPMNTPGLKVMSRKSYEQHAVSRFDNPLASRFDENDALMYFDDVKVPWERVFVYRDTDMCRAQFHDTRSHVYQNYQSQIRLMVKMKFMAGIARRLTETIGTIGIPSVAHSLGRLAAQTSMVEGMVYGMESAGERFGEYYAPSRSLMYASQVLTQELYPQYVNTIRELAGGSLIMLPSSVQDFGNEDMARIIRRTQLSTAMMPDDRVKFLKLAWDAVGSEFASRHVQYEMFYAGAQFVTCGHSFRTYDWAGAGALVDSLLEGYSIEEELAQAGSGGKGKAVA